MRCAAAIGAGAALQQLRAGSDAATEEQPWAAGDGNWAAQRTPPCLDRGSVLTPQPLSPLPHEVGTLAPVQQPACPLSPAERLWRVGNTLVQSSARALGRNRYRRKVWELLLFLCVSASVQPNATIAMGAIQP